MISVNRTAFIFPRRPELNPTAKGYPHLSKLMSDTTFVRSRIYTLFIVDILTFYSKPWLLSNIIDTQTSKVPEPLLEFVVLERVGVRVGVIGLVEKYANYPLSMYEVGH